MADFGMNIAHSFIHSFIHVLSFIDTTIIVSVAVSGEDWDGVKYTRESTGGTIVQTVYNGLSYTFCDLVPSYPVLCAQLYNNSMVYIPGYGWISVKVTFGDKECGTVNFNW